jgi:predicted amidohydrolase
LALSLVSYGLWPMRPERAECPRLLLVPGMVTLVAALWCNAGTGNPKLGHTSRINASGCYAQANLMWVVCCNAVAGDCYGTSVIVGPSGEPLVVLPTAEEALGITTINLALTADWDRYRQRLDPLWEQPTNR